LTKKNDLTRIEDLSELLHSEDEEDFQSIDSNSAFDEKTEPNHELDQDELIDSDSFSNDSTDPDLSIPDLDEPKEENNDFGSDFNSDFSSESSNEFSNDFNSDFNSDFNAESAESSEESASADFSSESDSDEFVSDFTTEEELPATPVVETPVAKTPAPTAKIVETPSPFELSSGPLKTERIQKAEDLSDIKKFAQNISYGDASAEGTPPFSLIIRNVRFVEDADGIIDALKEHGIAKDEALAKMRKSLELGSILISRISEYSAIYLAHKLRKFNVDIMMGLADEIHPPKSYKSDDKGLVNKRNIYQNKSESHKFISGDLTAEDIMLTTSNSFDNFQIEKYLGIISESTQFEIDEIHQYTSNDKNKNNLQVEIDNIISQFSSNNEKKDWDTKISDIYFQMANKLKPQALKLKGNAVVGIHYQLMALPTLSSEQKQVYRLICTGNVVWLLAEK
jgi:hypothetical protein